MPGQFTLNSLFTSDMKSQGDCEYNNNSSTESLANFVTNYNHTDENSIEATLKRKAPDDLSSEVGAAKLNEKQAQQLNALLTAAALQNSMQDMTPQTVQFPPTVPLFSPEAMLAQSLNPSPTFPLPLLGYHLSGDDKMRDSEADADNDANTAAGLQFAAMSYMLQQQQQMMQLESMGILANPASMNSFAMLAGMPQNSYFPSPETDESVQERLKRTRTASDEAEKRKPRTNSHTKSFHCSLCSKRFSFKEELEEHMLTHTSDELGNENYMQKSFACSECSFRTKYKFCLQRHMHIHSGEKPLVCPYCRYRSISKVSYDNHIRTHTGEKPFTCPYCSYKSSFKNNLTKHIKTHTTSPNAKTHTCTKCSSSFSSQIQLKSHMKLHLDPTQTHTCPQCMCVCMSRFELDCHMRTHVPAA